MNKEIKKIAKASGALKIKPLLNITGEPCLLGDEEIEEFANLLIKNCIFQILNTGPGVTLEQMDFANRAIENIRRRFGVEE